MHAWNRFKTKSNEVTSLLRERKKLYFDKLADLRRSSTSNKSWYKTTSKFLLCDSKLHDIPVLETENGIIETNLDKAEVLNDFFIKH